MSKYRRNLILTKAARFLRLGSLLVFLFSLLIADTVSAQMFGASTGFSNQSSATQKPSAVIQPENRPVASSRPAAASTAAGRATSKAAVQASAAGRQSAKAQTSSAQQPSANQPKEDQVKTPSVVQFRFVNGEVIADTKPKIMLYMRDFKVARNLNGRPSCTMRFYILSSAPEKITNISYRLKWPNIETALSFNDVAPNTPTFFDYALLGNGCYSMDKAPNIIVNRCRIKGMSQRQCADAIQWME